ncbi:DUF6221 family protein [Streptomyces sp. NBC_00237]|uniref:DUF6221 family protein n=1 Tax=Streptomyces sp. NBC_00237 TaxID=2975687 RepID=UPI002255AF76|nr:DUF6221 family protein [Streptomyces sp. NBC_00237]MCX5201057.1 DUF6221 family protein [Streptomyces sp. NBC_00237]
MTHVTDDLVEFLHARLAEDEAAARAASEPEEWVEKRPTWNVQYWADPDRAAVIADPDSSAYPVVTSIAGEAEDVAEVFVRHIARHDPARVLAEVDAKRRMLDASPAECPTGCRTEHSFSGSCSLRSMGPAWEAGGERWVRGDSETPMHAPHTSESTLRFLALPYAAHPDYRSDWRP